jgi:hypothetical protein
MRSSWNACIRSVNDHPFWMLFRWGRGVVCCGDGRQLLHSTDNGTHWEDATISGASIHFHTVTGNTTTLYLLGTPTLRARAELSNQNQPFVLLRFVGREASDSNRSGHSDRTPEQSLNMAVCGRWIPCFSFRTEATGLASCARRMPGETWNAVMLPDRADTIYGYFIYESLGDQGILVHRPRGNTRECYTSKDNGASWLRFDCPASLACAMERPRCCISGKESVLAFDEVTRAITVRGDDGRWLERSYPPFSEVSAFEIWLRQVCYMSEATRAGCTQAWTQVVRGTF